MTLHFPYQQNRNNSGILLLATLVLIVFLQSCKSTGTDPITPYNYFPLEIGRYSIYEVTETAYSAGSAKPVTKTWQEMDEIITMNEDMAKTKVFIISRSIRNSSQDAWTKIKQYSAQRYHEKLIVNIDNEVLMPLIFPYSPKGSWDGYKYFQLPVDDVREYSKHQYQNINQPLTINGLHFDKTLKVSERDEDDMIKFRLGYKLYAAEVGLIADEQTDYEYDQQNADVIGKKIIVSGTSRIKKIIEFGILK